LLAQHLTRNICLSLLLLLLLLLRLRSPRNPVPLEAVPTWMLIFPRKASCAC
jgi:hypothetical protein